MRSDTMPPAFVFCWTTRTGQVRFGSRDTRWMGSVPYTPTRFGPDAGTRWEPARPHDPGRSFLRTQGVTSRVALFTGGVVCCGAVVASPDPGRLRREVAAEWDRGRIAWWARAEVGLRDGAVWAGVALDDRDAARRVAAHLPAAFLGYLDEETLTVETPGSIAATHAGHLTFETRTSLARTARP
jgi:hypothetical protein